MSVSFPSSSNPAGPLKHQAKPSPKKKAPQTDLINQPITREQRPIIEERDTSSSLGTLLTKQGIPVTEFSKLSAEEKVIQLDKLSEDPNLALLAEQAMIELTSQSIRASG